MVGRERIVVGMSGGVDSSVAALLLLRSGYEVHGLHMSNWIQDDAYCTAAEDYQAARQVCTDLDIPLHRVNFSAEYRSEVFADFLRQYHAGRTPNPDVLCNRFIKFGSFLGHAQRLGATRIATGHYARLTTDRGLRLLKGIDTEKDQTYFLHAVKSDALAQTLFPIGHLTKAQVRRMANDAGLPNYSRPDSTGICFVGERPFREFLGRYVNGTAGPVLTPDGEELGRHEGLMFYTLGQRSGIGIGGRADGNGGAWYVAAKETLRNALIVVQGRDSPLLWSSVLVTGPTHWVSRAPAVLPEGTELTCQARIRHRHTPALCVVTGRPDGSLQVRFAEPQWAVSPGQYVVFYDDDECLGGAVIEYTADGLSEQSRVEKSHGPCH